VIVLDACVVIAFFDADNTHHVAAVEVVARGDALAMSVLSAAEALVHLARHGQGAQGLAALHQLEITIVPISDQEALALALTRAQTGLRMPDAIVVHLASRLGADIATFDQRLANQATRLGLSLA